MCLLLKGMEWVPEVPEVGGRLDGLETGEYWGLALLQQVDAHEHVAVAAQSAAVGVIHLCSISNAFTADVISSSA